MSFSENFWDGNSSEVTGFDILCQRIKDGRQMCKAYQELLKQRAQAQEQYGKMLIKISKLAGGKEELGSIRQSWEVLRIQTEGVGSAHVKMAATLQEEAKKIQEFAENQKVIFKQAEDNMSKINSMYKNAHKSVKEARRVYDVKSQEAEHVNHSFQKDKNKSNLSLKDLDKLIARQEKTSVARDQVELGLKEAIIATEDLRKLWISDMEKACKVSQRLEEERIETLRNSMWYITNMYSSLAVAEDDMNEELRKVLEKCSIENDIKLFIKLRGTGTKRPDAIKFSRFQSTCCQSVDSVAVDKKKKTKHPPLPVPDYPVPNGKISMSSPQVSTGAGDKSSPVYATIKEIQDVNNDCIENGGSQTSQVSTEMELVKNVIYGYPPEEELELSCYPKYEVVFMHVGQTPSELTLDEGEVVYVLGGTDTGWWEIITSSGQRGYYPATYLEKVDTHDYDIAAH